MKAFPSGHDPKTGTMQHGMELRDYFAARAMAVIMPAVVAELQRTSHSDEKTTQLKEAAANACYGIADAMMKAREA